MNAQQFLSAQLSAVALRKDVLSWVAAAIRANNMPTACAEHVCSKIGLVLDDAVTIATVTNDDTATGAARKSEDLYRPLIDQLLAALVLSLVANWHAEQDDE